MKLLCCNPSGVFLRSQIFDVGNGNEDKDQLVNPASYGLENTANLYFPSVDKTYESERVGAWLIRQGYMIVMLDNV